MAVAKPGLPTLQRSVASINGIDAIVIACALIKLYLTLQERQSLSEAQQLLEKLGYKGNVLQTAGQSLGSAPARVIDVLEPTEREQT